MKVVMPVITMIAKTVPLMEELQACEPEWIKGLDNFGGQAIIEFAGRECYQSWDRPNPATQTNAGYVESLIKQRHFSVLEHASATFRFKHVSRSFTHELVRHRHFSYSQLSQRYCDASEMEVVLHPDVMRLIKLERKDGEAHVVNHFVDERLDDVMESVRRFYEAVDEALAAEKKPVKQRRGAARGALPNMTATNIVVTGNLRAWRHFLLTRSSPHAEIEIRKAAWRVYTLLSAHFTAAFMDFEVMYVPGFEVDEQPPVLTSKYMEVE